MRSLFGRPSPEPALPGFYGKVPALGDFVSRRMPRGFLPAWDAWLQRLLEASRDRLGTVWLDAWLQAPIWHFALGRDVTGAARAFGVLIPSVDRVGRYFPFTVLGLAAAAGSDRDAWSRQAETLALSALEDGFDAAVLEAALAALGAPGGPAGSASAGSSLPRAERAGSAEAVEAALAALGGGETLWWSRTGDEGGFLVLRCPGLPGDEWAAGLVAGRFETEG